MDIYTVTSCLGLTFFSSNPKIGRTRIHKNQKVLWWSAYLNSSKVTNILAPFLEQRQSYEKAKIKIIHLTHSMSKPRELAVPGWFAIATSSEPLGRKKSEPKWRRCKHSCSRSTTGTGALGLSTTIQTVII